MPTLTKIIEGDKSPDFARIELQSGYDTLLKLETLLRMYIDIMPSPIPEDHQYDYANAVLALRELEKYLKKRDS